MPISIPPFVCRKLTRIININFKEANVMAYKTIKALLVQFNQSSLIIISNTIETQKLQRNILLVDWEIKYQVIEPISDKRLSKWNNQHISKFLYAIIVYSVDLKFLKFKPPCSIVMLPHILKMQKIQFENP